MAEPKIKENDNSTSEFIETVESVKEKANAYQIVDTFEKITEFKTKIRAQRSKILRH